MAKSEPAGLSSPPPAPFTQDKSSPMAFLDPASTPTVIAAQECALLPFGFRSQRPQIPTRRACLDTGNATTAAAFHT